MRNIKYWKEELRTMHLFEYIDLLQAITDNLNGGLKMKKEIKISDLKFLSYNIARALARDMEDNKRCVTHYNIAFKIVKEQIDNLIFIKK